MLMMVASTGKVAGFQNGSRSASEKCEQWLDQKVASTHPQRLGAPTFDVNAVIPGCHADIALEKACDAFFAVLPFTIQTKAESLRWEQLVRYAGSKRMSVFDDEH